MLCIYCGANNDIGEIHPSTCPVITGKYPDINNKEEQRKKLREKLKKLSRNTKKETKKDQNTFEPLQGAMPVSYLNCSMCKSDNCMIAVNDKKNPDIPMCIKCGCRCGKLKKMVIKH